MFNLFSVVNGTVVDKPTSDFKGHSVSINATTGNDIEEIIFLLIAAFIMGIFTHYAYVEIKKYIKKEIRRKKIAKKSKKIEEEKERE